MSWSYDPKLTDNKDKVRFLIDDADADDQLVQDEEITFMLGECGSIYRTASQLCETLQLRFSKQMSLTDGKGLTFDPQKQAEKYADLAVKYNARAAERGGTGLYFGGGLEAERETLALDNEATQPRFKIDQHRNPSAYIDLDVLTS